MNYLIHYGIKGMKWGKHKSAKKIDSTPLDGLHGYKRRMAENKLVNARIRAFDKKNPDMYKAQPKQGMYSATIRKVGTANITDFGRIGADYDEYDYRNRKASKIDKKAAMKIIEKANKERYYAQTTTAQRGMIKITDIFRKMKKQAPVSRQEKMDFNSRRKKR